MKEKEKIKLINKYKALSADKIKDLINEGGLEPDAYTLLAEEAKARGLTIIDDLWIREQIDILLNKCPFKCFRDGSRRNPRPVPRYNAISLLS